MRGIGLITVQITAIDVENATDKCTPYMLAVIVERFQIASLLADSGLFDKDFVNVEGRTITQIAEDRNRERALAYL